MSLSTFLTNILKFTGTLNGSLNGFTFRVIPPKEPRLLAITKPLTDPSILLTGACYVDHEGYDLNEIEQAYYTNSGISVTQDDTWYKDGGGDNKTSAILQPWLIQTNDIVCDGTKQFILDHAQFVYKLPIRGEAEQQIRSYATKRPELLRLVSSNFKCGLDLCIDILDGDASTGKIQPFVHIEWDYIDVNEMHYTAAQITKHLQLGDWYKLMDFMCQYNEKAHQNDIDAFAQADFRSMAVFGDKSYKLIPTL